ncbi:nucleotidyltransferase family protein [Cellvibrio fontiphilus]|uniref:NTP transferase domain-containing protein n=1 Tax=Cellvibrio fontiphilus TaxID=1815559 RepID=A0ABV7FHV1_9GAMM
MNNSTHALDCLILAAGNASRFGSCKQLADWKGQPLLAATIAAARQLNPARILVVGGAFYPQLLQALPALNSSAGKGCNTPVELLEFRAWNLGLGHSLAHAIKHLQNSNPVLVLLGDQPLVSAQDLQNLYRHWCAQPEKIACASFANTLGVPALFPAHFKARLYESRGDRGAKNILLRYRNQVMPVAMPSAEFDVDTPADLSKYLRKAV